MVLVEVYRSMEESVQSHQNDVDMISEVPWSRSCAEPTFDPVEMSRRQPDVR